MLLKDNLESLKTWNWYVLKDETKGLKLYAMAVRNYTPNPSTMDFIYINSMGILGTMSAKEFVANYPNMKITKVRDIKIDIRSNYTIEEQNCTYTCDL